MKWSLTSLAVAASAILLAASARCAPARAQGEDGSGKSLVAWKVAKELPRLGHRNWIVIADAAYPAQTRAGIETIYAGGDHLDAVGEVLEAVDAAKHVAAAPLLDAELKALAESDAPGIGDFRQQLGRLLEGRPVKRMPHEEIIHRLDEAARLFRVLVIKTDMTLPYTTVFLQLECGYWSAEQEARLREALESAE